MSERHPSLGRYYNINGEPIDFDTWVTLYELAEYKIVRRDTPSPGVTVSTVWLGLDHNYAGGGAPQIFETMIFGGDHDQECFRYATLAAAEDGHALAVALARGF